MKFLLFGTGDYYNRYKNWFEWYNVLALLDNSKLKQHTIIDGKLVLSPVEGVSLNYDIIVILSFYVSQMKQQLVSLGVDENKIYHFYDLHRLLKSGAVNKPLHYFLNAKEIVQYEVSTHKILLLSHDLELGGPEIALFHAAKILKEHGYMLVFASMWDGPLKNKLIENEIPVIVDENLQISTMQETTWVNSFSLIICNTLNFHVFLSKRSTEIPIVWWLHDSRFFYDGVNRDVMANISLRNLKVVTVGPVPAEAVREFLPHIKCEELLYGVEGTEDGIGVNRERGKIVRFVTVGFLENIKGQDVLVQAVEKLPDNVREQCEFYIVGYNKTLFGEQIRKMSEKMREIIFTGSVSHKSIYELLEVSSVLICPSRQDSMPTVAAEAMMHSVPCILSDATGTAEFIQHEENGMIFTSGDIQMLAKKIEWCVENKQKLDSMGKKAKILFDKYFSMIAFEEKFLKVINHILKKNNSEV